MVPLPLFRLIVRLVQLIYRTVELVVEVRIVDELANRPFSRLEVIDDGVHLRQDHVQAFDGSTSIALTTSVKLGVSRVFSSSPSPKRRANGKLTVDIDYGIAQDSNRRQRCLGVLFQLVGILFVQLHDDSDRRQRFLSGDATTVTVLTVLIRYALEDSQQRPVSVRRNFQSRS